MNETAHLILPITGMTCANCSATIERNLKKMPGVVSANVNYATERTVVEFIPTIVGYTEFKQKIVDIGYGVIESSGASRESLQDVEAQAREKEIAQQRRLLIVGVILTMPIFIIAMAMMLGLLPEMMWLNWVLFALATPVQFYVGGQYYVGGYKALKNGSANMDVLIALGSSRACNPRPRRPSPWRSTGRSRASSVWRIPSRRVPPRRSPSSSARGWM